jgi:hypothetical protein
MATLSEPVITWLVKKADDTSFTEKESYYAGNYRPNNGINLEFRIWNNRYGSQAVQNLEHFGISMVFDHYEDSALFTYMTFIVNNSEILTPSVVAGEAILVIPEEIVLSGAVNDGSSNYSNNYMSLKIKLDIPGNISVKNNDLKNLSLDIVKL